MRYENGPELKVVTHFDRTEALKVRPCDAFFCIALVSLCGLIWGSPRLVLYSPAVMYADCIRIAARWRIVP